MMQQIKINDPFGKANMVMQTQKIVTAALQDSNLPTQSMTTEKKPTIIVLGNEKGGTGKSTLCLHLAVALSHQHHKVAVLDLDERQGSTTHFLEFRKLWNNNAYHLNLPLPTIIRPDDGVPPPPENDNLKKNSTNYRIIHNIGTIKASIKDDVDYVIIDTPGSYTNRTLSALVLCDILITPANDSLMDLDVIGHIDPKYQIMTKPSNFAESVFFARKFRAALMRTRDSFKWYVLRNRLAHISNTNEKNIAKMINGLSRRLGFQIIDGITERVIFKELFSHGLTVFDLQNIPENIISEKKLIKPQQRSNNQSAQEEILNLCHHIGLIS